MGQRSGRSTCGRALLAYKRAAVDRTRAGPLPHIDRSGCVSEFSLFGNWEAYSSYRRRPSPPTDLYAPSQPPAPPFQTPPSPAEIPSSSQAPWRRTSRNPPPRRRAARRRRCGYARTTRLLSAPPHRGSLPGNPGSGTRTRTPGGSRPRDAAAATRATGPCADL